MKDIKDLIYAAVEENIVKFQQLTNDILHARAYDAIEALRPEVSASMFGEAKEMEDEDEEDEEDEDEEDEEMDDKKKSMKEALHPNQQKIDVVDDEKIDAKDFAKLRAMKKAKMKEDVEHIEENLEEGLTRAQHRKLGREHEEHLDKELRSLGERLPKAWDATALHKKLSSHPKYKKALHHANKSEHHFGKAATMKEDVELDESVFSDKAQANAVVKKLKTKHNDGNYHVVSNKDRHRVAHAYYDDSTVKKQISRLQEEVDQIDEVAMPRNQADWQALITHQIKTVGHPVATDAQFRATHGKDMTKTASLEPGEDKMSYAAAQGGEVKR